MVKVMELMKKDVITVKKAVRILHVLRIMKKMKISRVVVVDDEDKVIGIVTESNIMDRIGTYRMRKIPTSQILVSSVMSENVITTNPYDEVSHAAKLMIENGISGLPVLFGEDLVGIITKTDVVAALTEIKGFKAIDVMDNKVKVVGPKTRVIQVRQSMLKSGIEYVVVADKDEVLGIVTDRDIAYGLSSIKMSEKWRHLDEVLDKFFVVNITRRGIPTVSPEDELRDVAKILVKEHMKAIPVMSEGKLIGCVSKTSVTKAVADGKIVL
ncbi:MAG: CBS domain-containing protein [Candidatus Odinarchaeota archaeon]|nr:CBS domain-containing protein [Candidatus Odinarchaeota archaeon]